MKKFQFQKTPEPKALSQLLGPPQGQRAEEPPCAAKMGLEDAYVHVHLRVYSKYRLIYEFKQGAIYESLLGKKESHLAARKFEHYLIILADVISEQFVGALRAVFGWWVERGRQRPRNLVLILPESYDKPTPEKSESAPEEGSTQHASQV